MWKHPTYLCGTNKQLIMNNEFEAQLKALLYSQQPESINLAVSFAKGLGVDLKALLAVLQIRYS
jgi:hypothetical protein